jgi:hypothetical protein
MNDPIEELVGIGPKSAGWLRGIGIRTRADLERIGVIDAFRQVRAAGHPASFNLLWALQGALQEIHWTMVPPKVRDDLRRAVAASRER